MSVNGDKMKIYNSGLTPADDDKDKETPSPIGDSIDNDDNIDEDDDEVDEVDEDEDDDDELVEDTDSEEEESV